MPRMQVIPPEPNDPYAFDHDGAGDDEEINEFADPFEILAAREERAGLALIFLVDHDD